MIIMIMRKLRPDEPRANAERRCMEAVAALDAATAVVPQQLVVAATHTP